MADFVFADGRQLLQRAAVVGERSGQPRKLCPPCRTETEKTFTKNKSRPMTYDLCGRPNRRRGSPRGGRYQNHRSNLEDPGGLGKVQTQQEE